MATTTELEKEMKSLARRWKALKSRETKANQQRLEVEENIMRHLGEDVPPKGTYHANGGLKIVTGFSEKWDQDALSAIEKTWQHGDGATGFPFRSKWEPDNKAICILREKEPAVYAELEPALSITPKKPSFSSE